MSLFHCGVFVRAGGGRDVFGCRHVEDISRPFPLVGEARTSPGDSPDRSDRAPGMFGVNLN